eukprot:Skav225743  [mRNA]  locus=scaffold28:65594:65977:- [translate_table: standard]
MPWVLILEDNLVLAQPVERVRESISEIVRWVTRSSRPKWSVVHLSLVHSAASLRLRRVEENVVRVERTAPDWYGPVSIKKAPGLGTTAYIISREAMEKVLRLKSDFEMPIDDLLTETLCKSSDRLFR